MQVAGPTKAEAEEAFQRFKAANRCQTDLDVFVKLAVMVMNDLRRDSSIPGRETATTDQTP